MSLWAPSEAAKGCAARVAEFKSGQHASGQAAWGSTHRRRCRCSHRCPSRHAARSRWWWRHSGRTPAGWGKGGGGVTKRQADQRTLARAAGGGVRRRSPGPPAALACRCQTNGRGGRGEGGAGLTAAAHTAQRGPSQGRGLTLGSTVLPRRGVSCSGGVMAIF